MAPTAVPEQIVSVVVPLHGRGDGRHEVTELRLLHAAERPGLHRSIPADLHEAVARLLAFVFNLWRAG